MSGAWLEVSGGPIQPLLVGAFLMWLAYQFDWKAILKRWF
jgi:hypothetical protein